VNFRFKNMKKVMQSILFICALSFATNSQAQWQWAKQSTSAGSRDEQGYDIALDNNSNSYSVGSYHNSATFGTAFLSGQVGTYSMYLTKLNFAGSFLWAVNASGPSGSNGKGLNVSTNGTDVFVTGVFTGNITFFSTNSTTITVNGLTSDCILAKYNSSGVIQWATPFAGSGTQWTNDIDINDPKQKIYLTGLSGSRGFVNCYNYSGVLQWSHISA
jgi:hypothetical protein